MRITAEREMVMVDQQKQLEDAEQKVLYLVTVIRDDIRLVVGSIEGKCAYHRRERDVDGRSGETT